MSSDESPPRTFTCAICGHPYATFTTEAEANREFLESGQNTEGQELHSVCDGCYELVMAKAGVTSPET